MIATVFALMYLVTSAPPTGKPELLPPTPEGWRFERLEFPLAFAPELKYQGFEELNFAPGMFNDKSDWYFTYVFAMKLEGKGELDAKGLSALLEVYYRGLCLAVAKGTEFEIEPSRISAEVKEDHFEAPRSRHFHATLESYDPFVTGKPLTLYVEILVVQEASESHRLFAAVSPKPTSHAVWQPMRTIKRTFLASQTE